VGTNEENIYFARAFAALTFTEPDYIFTPMITKIIFPILISLLMGLVIASRKERVSIRRICSALLCVSIFAEIFSGLLIFSQIYSTNDAHQITDYYKRETALTDTLPDDSFYRVLQTSYHTDHVTLLPASYNEPMAFGFNSVTSFVSDPDESAIFFMDKVGYAAHSETITITSSENLAADSLLGVKYVMLPAGSRDCAGLDLISENPDFKDLYSNPYAFPVAFVYHGTGNYESYETVPMLYLNDICKTVTGTGEDLFIPVSSSVSESNNGFSYSVDLGKDYDPSRYILYADLLTDTKDGAFIYVNGEKLTHYSVFLAPSAVRIASFENEVEVAVTFDNQTDPPSQVTDAHFYLLSLDALKKASDAAHKKEISDYVLEDGYGRFNVMDASEGDSLFLSIPSENGWTITLNGHETECNTIGNCLMSVPLENGKNVIEIRYRVPYLTEGLILSVTGMILCAVLAVIENLNTQRSSKTRHSGKNRN